VKYGVDDEAKGDEVLPGTEVLRMIQEEEEEEEEPVAHEEEEEEEDHQVHQVQEPVHLIGRKIRVQTTTQGVFRHACVGPFEFRGTLVGLFELNGERAIHIVTTNGENHMFTTSQIMTLQMFHPEEDEETEELSPIPHCDQDQVQNEVIQIEDDEVDQNEVIQIDQNEVIQIEDDEEQVQEEPEEPEEPACCAICLDATDAARNFVSLCCGHQFHFACIMGNMANGGHNRNQCPMCRSAVVQEYHIANEHEEIQQVMQRNQQLAHELERTREYRGQIAAEYMHVVNMNLQIRMRYDEEQEARDALHRRGYAFGLNERIAAIVANAANNDIRQNYENGAAVHVERQILDLCMSFGMTAYDRQYDQNPIQYEDEMAE
jgi:hypothetical protein